MFHKSTEFIEFLNIITEYTEFIDNILKNYNCDILLFNLHHTIYSIKNFNDLLVFIILYLLMYLLRNRYSVILRSLKL